MALWKERGYVPDSDEEEDGYTELSPALTTSNLHYKAARSVDPFRQHDESATSTNATSFQQDGVLAPARFKSTVEQLEETLSQGLLTVRNILNRSPSPLQLILDDDSPLSSLPSSAVSSPRWQAKDSETAISAPVSKDDQPLVHQQHNDVVDFTIRRALRTRAPIQLHPYLLENVQYVESMKARGMKPVHASKGDLPANQKGRAEESQDTDVFQSSQVEETQSFDLPSSPTIEPQVDDESQSPLRGTRMHKINNIENFEDDLPDLSQILKDRGQPKKTGLKSKSRKSLLPHKTRHAKTVAKVQDASIHQDDLQRSRLPGTFRVPPSPPFSSSPELFDRVGVAFNSDAPVQATTPSALLTPLLSSEQGFGKRARLIMSDSDGSLSDTDTDARSNTPPGHEDPRPAMSRMGRRFRGVLPASWLKLDMKAQTRPTDNQRAAQPMAYSVPDKGVAQRSRRKSNALTPRRLASQVFDTGDQESDHSDDATHSTPLVIEFLTDTEDSHDITLGEAMEDDVVDAMLPSAGTRRRRTNRDKPQLQRNLNDDWRGSTSRKAQAHASENGKSQSYHRSHSSTMSRRRKKMKTRHKSPPMSVFDAPGLTDTQKSAQPRFLKLAARQARRINPRIGLPATRKVFCLETSLASNEVYGDLNDLDNFVQPFERRASDTADEAPNGAVVVDQPTNESISHTSKSSLATASHPSHELTALRTSTNSLLKRISSRKKDTIGEDNQHIVPTAPPSKTARIDHLQSLFSHQNRSGNGRLVSTISDTHPVRTETVKLLGQHQLQVLRIRQKIPRKVNANQRLPTSTLPVSKDPSAKESSNGCGSFPSKPSVYKKARKQVPRKWNAPDSSIPTAVQSTSTVHTGMRPEPRTVWLEAADAYEQSLNQAPFDSETIRKVQITSSLLKPSWAFGPHTVFESRIMQSGALSQTISRSHNASHHFSEAKASSSLLRMPGLGFHVSVSHYTETAAVGLEQCHEHIRGILRDATHQKDPSALADCINGLESIVGWVNEDISFSPKRSNTPSTPSLGGTSMSYLNPIDVEVEAGLGSQQHAGPQFITTPYRFLSMSMSFIRDTATHIQVSGLNDQDVHYSLLLELQNWLIAHAFQLRTIAHAVGAHEDEAKGLCHEMMLAALRAALGFVRLSRSHAVALTIDHVHPAVLFSFDSQLPSANTILVTWHISRAISNDTSSYFYDLLENSVTQELPGNPINDACTALSAMSFIVRFQDLNSKGGYIMDKGDCASSGEAGWTFLIPFVSRLVVFLNSSTLDSKQDSLRHQFMKSIVTFLMELSFKWQWPPIPILVSVLLKIYSSNDMLPYEDIGDEASIFYNHNLIDKVPPAERNDYDKFIDLVRMTIALQRNPHDYEEGSRSAITASRLRGLVYSLLPNNVLLHDAKFALRADEFLGLKNNFALYLALYKSVPEGCRPRIEVLSRQVDLTQSHEMVSKLAIKVWEVVACFEIEQHHSGSGTMEEIGKWMNSMLLQIEQRAQFGAQDVFALFQTLFRTLRVCLSECPSENIAHQVFEAIFPNLKRLLLHDRRREVYIGQDATLEGLKALEAYLKTILDTRNTGTLTSEIQVFVAKFLTRIFHDEFTPPLELVLAATSTWFCAAQSFVQTLHKNWEDYLSPHSTLSLSFIAGETDHRFLQESQEYFVAKVIEVEKDTLFLEYRPLIFATWVAALVLPVHNLQTESLLTSQIIRYGGDSLNLNDAFYKIKSNEGSGGLPDWDFSDARFILLRHLLENMYGQQDEPESEWLAGGLDQNDMQMLLHTITTTMKNAWTRFNDDPVSQNEYTSFVEAVINEIEIYPFKGFKLDSWFTDGTGFPRRSQTFENMFRCRFGEEGGEIEKSFIVTFRLQIIQALKFGRQNSLANDLARVFHCTDTFRVRHDSPGYTSYSTDLIKQTRFLHIILPVYIDQASTAEGAAAVMPVIECLTFVARSIFFRIDNLEPGRMASFIVAMISCLFAVRSALRAQAQHTQATAPLLKYARTAIEVIWTLVSREEIQVDEEVHEAFTANVMGLVVVASGLSPGGASNETEVEEVAVRFFAHFRAKQKIFLNEKEEELRRFAADDWRAAVSRLKMEGVEEVRFEKEEVEEEARKLLALVGKLPLLPDEEE